MPPHRVRKGTLKKVVVARQQLFGNGCEEDAPSLVQISETADWFEGNIAPQRAKRARKARPQPNDCLRQPRARPFSSRAGRNLPAASSAFSRGDSPAVKGPRSPVRSAEIRSGRADVGFEQPLTAPLFSNTCTQAYFSPSSRVWSIHQFARVTCQSLRDDSCANARRSRRSPGCRGI